MLRFFFIVMIALSSANTCQAQKYVSSSPDPFIFRDPEVAPGVVAAGYNVLTGRTQVSPVLVAERTALILYFGQSLVAGNDNAGYVPTSTKVQTLNIFNGGIYQSLDPQLGAGGLGGSYTGRVGQKLIDGNKFDRVITMAIAVGGSSVAMWAPGGVANKKMLAAIARARVVMMPTAVIVDLGIQDDSLATSQASYTTSQQAMISSLRSAGYTGHIFINLESGRTGTSTSTAVRAAQAAVVDNPNLIYAGYDSDLVPSTGTYRYDGTHFTATGSDTMATGVANILIAHTF